MPNDIYWDSFNQRYVRSTPDFTDAGVGSNQALTGNQIGSSQGNITDQPVRVVVENRTFGVGGSSQDPFGNGTGGGTPVGPFNTGISTPLGGQTSVPSTAIGAGNFSSGNIGSSPYTGPSTTVGKNPTFPYNPILYPNDPIVYEERITDNSDPVYTIVFVIKYYYDKDGNKIEIGRTEVSRMPKVMAPPSSGVAYTTVTREVSEVDPATGDTLIWEITETVEINSGIRKVISKILKRRIQNTQPPPPPPPTGGGGANNGGGKYIVREEVTNRRNEQDDDPNYWRVVEDVYYIWSDGTRTFAFTRFIDRIRKPITEAPKPPVIKSTVYTRFNPDEDIIRDRVYDYTKGLWSGDVGNLYNFFTSSLQSATQKEYHYDIYQSASSANCSAIQFGISYGHRLGSGSTNDGGDGNDTPSRVMYSQHRLLCLEPEDTTFTFVSASVSVDSDHIYVININRSRISDRLDPGNVELNLCRLNGSGLVDDNSSATLRLIDSSGQTTSSFGHAITSPIYPMVSGSVDSGVYSTTREYGYLYPDLGMIVLDGNAMDEVLNFGTVTGSAVDGDNAMKLFRSISGSASTTSVRSLKYPFSARSSKLRTTEYYFVRAKSNSYNFSNNPTWVTGSSGAFLHNSFEGDPRTFITSIGLYDDDYRLLAVAKVSKAIEKTFFDERLFKIRLNY